MFPYISLTSHFKIRTHTFTAKNPLPLSHRKRGLGMGALAGWTKRIRDVAGEDAAWLMSSRRGRMRKERMLRLGWVENGTKQLIKQLLKQCAELASPFDNGLWGIQFYQKKEQNQSLTFLAQKQKDSSSNMLCVQEFKGTKMCQPAG